MSQTYTLYFIYTLYSDFLLRPCGSASAANWKKRNFDFGIRSKKRIEKNKKVQKNHELGNVVQGVVVLQNGRDHGDQGRGGGTNPGCPDAPAPTRIHFLRRARRRRRGRRRRRRPLLPPRRPPGVRGRPLHGHPGPAGPVPPGHRPRDAGGGQAQGGGGEGGQGAGGAAEAAEGAAEEGMGAGAPGRWPAPGCRTAGGGGSPRQEGQKAVTAPTDQVGRPDRHD